MTNYVFNGANGTTPASLGLLACTVNDGLTDLSVQSAVLNNAGAFTYADFLSPNAGANNHCKIIIPSAAAGGSVYYSSGFQRQVGGRVRSATAELGYRAFPVGAASNTICTGIQIRRQMFGFIGNLDLTATPWDLSTNGAMTFEFWMDDNGDAHVLFNATQYDFPGTGAGLDQTGDPVITLGGCGGFIYNNGTAGGSITSFDDGAAASFTPRNEFGFNGGMQDFSGGIE